MRAVDLGGIEARLLGPPDAVGKGGHQVGDLLFGQLVRDSGVEGLGDRRGAEGGLQAVAMHAGPGVVDLAEDLGPLIVDHLGALAQARDANLVEELDALGRRRIGQAHVEVATVILLPASRPKGEIRRARGMDADERRAAPGPLLEVAQIALLRVPRAMGGHHDAVPHREVADLQWFEEAWKVGHGFLLGKGRAVGRALLRTPPTDPDAADHHHKMLVRRFKSCPPPPRSSVPPLPIRSGSREANGRPSWEQTYAGPRL